MLLETVCSAVCVAVIPLSAARRERVSDMPAARLEMPVQRDGGVRLHGGWAAGAVGAGFGIAARLRLVTLDRLRDGLHQPVVQLHRGAARERISLCGRLEALACLAKLVAQPRFARLQPPGDGIRFA